MKPKPILPEGHTTPTTEIREFIHWLLKIGLNETAEIHVSSYQEDINKNFEFIRMQHSGYWSRSSI